MTSVKIKFRKSEIPEQPGYIYYQIINQQYVRNIKTAYFIYQHEWDSEKNMIRASRSGRTVFCDTINELVKWEVGALEKMINDSQGFSAPNLLPNLELMYKKLISGYPNIPSLSLFVYMRRHIFTLINHGKMRTAEIYASSLSSIRKCLGGEEIPVTSLDELLVGKYETYLTGRHLVPNTRSFYMRALRATYNMAVKDGYKMPVSPFGKVYTGVAKTKKRALPLHILKMIKQMNLSKKPSQEYARDMFLLSFYLRGMSFVDMAFLRKSDIKNGHLVYFRKKTGQRLKIEWCEEMQSIIDKYPSTSDYLLPIIGECDQTPILSYRNKALAINRGLKKISDQLQLNFTLTLYVARHTWASTAFAKGIPISLISEGMGHESEATTRIYLATIETGKIDTANRKIIRSIF